MQFDALLPYELALQHGHELALASPDGRVFDLDVERWLAPIDATDATVLDRCTGPTLDVGCGPGRFVSALLERGTPALGVDIAETAVALTRFRGSPALLRSVFDRVPGAGRWPSILLMDGNIGIGGDPPRLLERLKHLMAYDGVLIVEANTDPEIDEVLSVRFRVTGAATGPPFTWAIVGSKALEAHAEAVGLHVSESWTGAGRTFMSLTARRRSRTT